MNTFMILSDPNRRQILNLLLDGPRPVNSVVDNIGMSQPVVSKHLRILKDAGLVNVTPDGQRRLYSIRPEPLLEIENWLTPYRAFWKGKIDALSDYLDESTTEENRDGQKERRSG